MKTVFRHSLVAAALASVQLTAPAVDLDLYTNAPTTTMNDAPNVLFIIDNTANWNTAFSNEMSALKNTLANLPAGKFNVGFMLSSESGGQNKGNEGGYIRGAIRPMTDANKLKYVALVNSFDKLADKGNGGASGLNISEAWFYFKGTAPYSGNQKVKTDYTGNTDGTAADKAAWALAGNALTAYAGSQYRSPIVSGGCGKNYIIYISNGPNQQNSSANTTTNNLLAAAAGGGAAGAAAIAEIAISPSGSKENPSDEWTRFMKKSDLGITTFTIDVNPVTNGQGPGWTALLKSMSGLSNYRAVTSGGTEIEVAINEMLSKIQSVNSVFAAVSLPASATVQGAYLNQLYVGMFRPDPDAKPLWMGNIKQYRMGSDGLLADADGNGAINGQTGFITECARSYWTPLKSSPDTYWLNDPKGKCIPTGSNADLYAVSNTPDGNIVEKGAQAYTLREMTPASRVVKTCSTSGCTALGDFSISTVSQAALGASNAGEQSTLVDWAKGQNLAKGSDPTGELGKPTTIMRPSSHGDVIHSNPLAMSYSTSDPAAPDVVVYYGSNDGMLHAINGNQTRNIASTTPGKELWAFMPPEFFGNIKRLYTNSERINIALPLPQVAAGAPKPYAVDGPITAFKNNTSAWLYASMRRGGRALYAFNVTNKAAPSLKWRVGCPIGSDTGCTTGAEGMGQTWSAARPVRAAGYLSGASPLLVMGGGYDDCEDTDLHTCTSTSKGHKVYVLDADNGTILKELDTDRGVVGDVRIIPDAQGLAKYGYAADLGGNLYRINMGALAPSLWTITKIASLGCATAATCTSNRKFMFSPSVIPEADGSISLYIGSGDREKPLGAAYFPNTAAVQNYFFKVTDKPEDANWLSSEAGTRCAGQAVVCLASLSSVGDTDENTAATCGGTQALNSKGWYLGLRPTEQVVTLAATRFGVTTFSTHMPAVAQVGACSSNLGTVHVYNQMISTGAPLNGSCSAVVTGGGLPPPPEKMDICLNDACTATKPTCIGCSSTSPIELTPDENEAPGVGPNAKRRVYWYIQQ